MTVTTNALTELRDAANDRWESKVTHIGWGTGTTDSTSADTALETEIVRKAVGTITRDDANGKITIPCHLLSTDGNGSVLAEIGLFSASSGGTMYLRALITPITKTNVIEGWVDVIVTNTITGD